MKVLGTAVEPPRGSARWVFLKVGLRHFHGVFVSFSKFSSLSVLVTRRFEFFFLRSTVAFPRIILTFFGGPLRFPRIVSPAERCAPRGEDRPWRRQLRSTDEAIIKNPPKRPNAKN